MTGPATTPADPDRVERRHVEALMGTAVSLLVLGPADRATQLDEGIAAAVAWLHEVDDRFTTWRPGSEWLRYCAGEVDLDEAHPDLRHVVDAVEQLADASGGAFSVTANPDRPPDPAAYVKGWSLQRATELLLLAGADAVCVNGGGDIVVAGGDRPWRIGVQDPIRHDALVGWIELQRGAVATSGAYERGDHIREPGTGAAPTTYAGVTVVGPDLGLADAYATAAFAMGERAPDWLAGLPGYHGYLVRPDGTTESVGFAPAA